MIDSCPLDVAESLCLLKKEWISEVKHDISIKHFVGNKGS